MVAAAVVGAGVLGAGASIVGSQSAASAQKSAANQANATQQGFFNTTQENLAPYIAAGNTATNQLQNLEGANGPSNIMSTLQSLPGYQFANYQGLKSVENSATSRGLGVSGAAQKGAANFATGEANQYYNSLIGNIQNTANMGANAAAGLGTAATQTGSGIASNTLGAGNAAAAANNATGSAIGNAAGSVPSALLIGNYLQNQATNNSNYLTQVDPAVSEGLY